MQKIFLLILSISCLVRADIPAGKNGFKSKVMPFFKANCIDCHGPQKSKGKITVHTLLGEFSSGHDVEHWEHILDALKSGEMPPEDEEQPSKADRAAVIKWIDQGLRAYVKTESQKPATGTTRRLTNFEYENTMRDLLGVDLRLIQYIPEDPGKPYHFNNSSTFMLMGMEQMDRYKEAARRALQSVIVDPSPPKIHKTRREWKIFPSTSPTNMRYDSLRAGRGSAKEGLGLKSFPQTGEFRIRINTAAIFPTGVTELPLRLGMGYPERNPVGTVALKNNLDNFKVYEFQGRIENHPPKPGVKGKNGKTSASSLSITPQNLFDDGTLNDHVSAFKRARVIVRWIEFEAPIFKSWPPKYHKDILFDSPLRKSNPAAYVTAVLKRFMTRAFRRPVTAKEVARYATIFKNNTKEIDSFEENMRETLTMVLISPNFLYHRQAAHPQYELASKISYFLWGSMPDKELVDLAKANKLSDNNVVKSQVQRLLKDKRSKDFVDNFTVQWLSIAKAKLVKINRDRFPRFLYVVSAGESAGTEVPFRPSIRDYMEEESLGFVAELIKRNASVENLVDSDFAFLNQRLAEHYGVKGVEGHELRPIPIKPEHHLGGLLTHGSVLIGNGTGTTPHPIYRAVWLREAILGDEVSDPPADVPSLSDSAGEAEVKKAVTIKDLLAKHRNVESCNDCHVRLDPWGIPFEEYNAIGQFQPLVPQEGVKVRAMIHPYRGGETYEEYKAYLKKTFTKKLDASARVPHGPKVMGMRDLKKHLIKDRKGDIAQNMIKRFLTYGLGRELSYRDRYEVEELLKKSKENGYKLQDMIVSICQSKLFKGKKK